MQNALDANLYMHLSYSLKLDYEINGIIHFRWINEKAAVKLRQVDAPIEIKFTVFTNKCQKIEDIENACRWNAVFTWLPYDVLGFL